MNLPALKTPAQSEALVTISVFAALADGDKSEIERSCVRDLAEELELTDAGSTARQVFLGKTTLDQAISTLEGSTQKQLAYEMALAVCEISGDISPLEREFLNELKSRLQLGGTEAAEAEREVQETVHEPLALAVTPPALPKGSDNHPMILRYSILNGALELLPESMATMAIIPLQMKMVYRIGKTHGVELDSGHIREFLATIGLGMGSQMLEGFARKLFGKLGKSVGGKIAGRVANQAAGSAMSFASTYAIGHLAETYYAGGRKLGTASMKATFNPLQQKALEMHSRYLPEIQDRARNLDVTSVMNLVRGNAQP